MSQYVNAFEVGDKVRFLGWSWDRRGNAAHQGKIVDIDRSRHRVKVEEEGGPRDGNSHWYGMQLFFPFKKDRHGKT